MRFYRQGVADPTLSPRVVHFSGGWVRRSGMAANHKARINNSRLKSVSVGTGVRVLQGRALVFLYLGACCGRPLSTPFQPRGVHIFSAVGAGSETPWRVSGARGVVHLAAALNTRPSDGMS